MNCTRVKRMSRDAAKARAKSVLATPGTPSRSTCPGTNKAAISPLTTASWPTTTFAISLRTAVTPSRALPVPGRVGAGEVA